MRDYQTTKMTLQRKLRYRIHDKKAIKISLIIKILKIMRFWYDKALMLSVYWESRESKSVKKLSSIDTMKKTIYKRRSLDSNRYSVTITPIWQSPCENNHPRHHSHSRRTLIIVTNHDNDFITMTYFSLNFFIVHTINVRKNKRFKINNILLH